MRIASPTEPPQVRPAPRCCRRVTPGRGQRAGHVGGRERAEAQLAAARADGGQQARGLVADQQQRDALPAVLPAASAGRWRRRGSSRRRCRRWRRGGRRRRRKGEEALHLADFIDRDDVRSAVAFSFGPRRSRNRPGSDRAAVRRATGWSGGMSSVSGGGGANMPPSSGGWPAGSGRSSRRASPCPRRAGR